MDAWRTTADHLVTVAVEDRGLGETPPGSNRNKITGWYGEAAPWCAMSLAYWTHKAGGPDVRKAFYCPEWAATTMAVAAARKLGLWHPGDSGIRRGDWPFYKLPGGDSGFVNHCGVATFAGDKLTIMAVEGNCSNSVKVVTRARGYIVGYIRPPYSPPSPGPVAPPFPGRQYFQVGARNDYVPLVDRELIRLFHPVQRRPRRVQSRPGLHHVYA